MATQSSTVAHIGPAWNRHEVTTFNGTFDTHIETGEDYDTLTLAEIFNAKPGNFDKTASPAFIPSSYCGYDAREHARQRAEGSFVALCGDVDEGDVAPERIESLVRGFCNEAAWLIFATSHARPGNMRWRIIIPLDAPLDFNAWYDAQLAFFAFMEANDVVMDHALARAAQPVYLPNVPDIHAKSGTPLRGEDGKPLYFMRKAKPLSAPGLNITEGTIAVHLGMIWRQREADEHQRERLRAEAAERRANRPQMEGGAVIEDFNRTNDIATLLEIYGYQQSPRDARDWRSPYQTGETYATRIMDGDKWVSLSGSDVGNRVGQQCRSGCFGDAYDLFVHFSHGGDHKAAFRALYAERRAAALPAYSPPPPVQHDDPGPQEEDFAGMDDVEPVFDVVDVEDMGPAAEEADTFPLLTLAQLETLPAPTYLVDKFITDDGLTIAYGDPGSGKSFVTVDLSMRLALGWDWHGQKTQRTGVLYIAGEGVRGIGKRTRGWRLRHKVDGVRDIPFALMPTAAQILDPGERARLCRTIDKARVELGFDVGLVVIDTVSRSIAGADENTQETMSAFVKACDDIRAHIGGAVLGVHHSGKNKDAGMRGSTVLLGACDATFKVEKHDLLLTLTCEKQKDDEEPAPVYFDMEKYGWPAPRDDDPEHWDTTLVPMRREARPDATEGISRDMVRRAFTMMVDAWTAGKPLSNKAQTREGGRYAPAIFARQIGGDAKAWKELICCWLENRNLTEETADGRSKLVGLQVLEAVL